MMGKSEAMLIALRCFVFSRCWVGAEKVVIDGPAAERSGIEVFEEAVDDGGESGGALDVGDVI